MKAILTIGAVLLSALLVVLVAGAVIFGFFFSGDVQTSGSDSVTVIESTDAPTTGGLTTGTVQE